MSQQVYRETEAFTTRWDPEIESVVHEWKKYVDGELFREGARSMLELAEERNSKTILIDHRDMTLVDREDQEYIMEEWLPRAVEIGADYHVVVHEESTIAEMNLDDIVDIEEHDHTSRMTDDMDEAREWIAEQ
ncbi:hypothetical protein SAMN05216388_100188 [Halorientalis persicus]|uniref:SpoIIAA-like n=1 Tax=Halorientalis persicus TaxID=1367881 RepID=A0A1H8CV67_9EURY|nr:hypothetical protein [Halorientalis persicus]SEM98769.1 hypothetical protein SAMN05216388_100188 [Halorientalis persicus]